MSQGLKRIQAVFYCSPSGAEPVRHWLRQLSAEDRRRIGFDIATLEFGWPVGMPLCRAMGNGLWEIRSDLLLGRTARVLFTASGGKLVLLHGFIKKDRKTPAIDLAIARRRQKEVAP